MFWQNLDVQKHLDAKDTDFLTIKIINLMDQGTEDDIYRDFSTTGVGTGQYVAQLLHC